jgi:uncharacterized protein with HEPN domain
MPDRTKKLLFDILIACTEIVSFTENKTRESYLADVLIRRAVERDFEIIGEAMGQLRALDGELFNQITDGPRIVGMRNRLIHAYAQVNDDVVWDVVQQNIPKLLAEVQILLTE